MFTMLTLVSMVAAAPTVELYTRAPGVHARFERKPAPTQVVVVDLSERPQENAKLHDPQYNETRTWRGVPLRSLVLSYKHSANADLLVFHFDNGMIIPWPHTKAALDELDAFVALAWQRSDGVWERDLESARRQDNFFNDPAPIVFHGNKLVSSSGHVPGLKSTAFNPWRHVGSLVKVEFADRAAWEKQLDFVDKQSPYAARASRGRDLFQERCVYCHGVRDVGGDLGPDVARPLAITDYRAPEAIRLKVKVHRMDAWASGLRMPPQKDLRDDEVSALIEYFHLVGKERARSPAYQP